MVMSRSLRGGAHGRFDALVAAATAEIAGHRIHDVLVGWSGLRLQERRGGHDLSGLAVAALRHAERAPCDLYGVLALRVEPLDGHDGLAAEITHRHAAGAYRFTVEMDRARAAQRDTAAELGAGQPKLVTQVPHQRHRRIAVE